MAKKKPKDMKKKLRRAIERKMEERIYKSLNDNHIELIKAQCAATVDILKKERSLEGVLKLALNATSWGERLVNEVLKKVPPPQPIACQKGCAFCCHLELETTAPEVIYVAEFLRKKLTIDEAVLFRQQIKQVTEKTRRMNANERSRSRLSCPLLEDKLCSVHPVRPLFCRGWNSLDVQACQVAYETGNPKAPIPRYRPQYQTISFVQFGILAGLHVLKYQSKLLNFATALEIALEEADAGKKWVDHKPVFAPAQVIDQIKLSSWFWKNFHPNERR